MHSICEKISHVYIFFSSTDKRVAVHSLKQIIAWFVNLTIVPGPICNPRYFFCSSRGGNFAPDLANARRRASLTLVSWTGLEHHSGIRCMRVRSGLRVVRCGRTCRCMCGLLLRMYSGPRARVYGVDITIVLLTLHHEQTAVRDTHVTLICQVWLAVDSGAVSWPRGVGKSTHCYQGGMESGKVRCLPWTRVCALSIVPPW